MDFLPAREGLDPTLFAVNWDVTLEVLAMIVLLAFVIERALAQLFESDAFLRFEKKRKAKGGGKFKSLIAFALAALGCWLWEFDALAILLQREQMTLLGTILTGAVIAGGSKGAIKLFHDVLGWKRKVAEEAGGGGAGGAPGDGPAGEGGGGERRPLRPENRVGSRRKKAEEDEDKVLETVGNTLGREPDDR